MYTVNNDSRIFMTPVLDYDAKTAAYVLATDGEELVFQNKNELVRHLAFHTDTHGADDPSRWNNDLIPRQFAKGRAAQTWIVKKNYSHWYAWEKTENWDYWFHDAFGRTIDVGGFWTEVIAAVYGGNKEEIQPSSGNRHGFGFRKWHNSRGGRRHGKIGFYRFLERESFRDDEDELILRWEPRGKLLVNKRSVTDWDWFDFRSKHSTDWKEHKCAHQWEHNVRAREKHQKNRNRKAVRRGKFLFADRE